MPLGAAQKLAVYPDVIMLGIGLAPQFGYNLPIYGDESAGN